MVRELTPIRERAITLAAHPDDVWDVLRDGARRAGEVARATIEEVRRRVGVRR